MKATTTKAFDFPIIVRRFLLSWLASVTIAYCVLPKELQDLNTLDALSQMWLPAVLILCVIFFVALCVLGLLRPSEQLERWLFTPFFGILAFFSLKSSFTVGFLCLCLLILAALVCYATQGWNSKLAVHSRNKKSHPVYCGIVAIMAAAFVVFVSVWTVCRVYSFHTPTFDFGIFSQMFYNMKTTGLPMTTVERDGLLSHFHVHVSPIYYLLLPIYWLIPTPATLQVMQAVILASAVIPLFLICKRHKLNPWLSTLACLLLLVYPAYAGGTSYDIHENAFLTPLILWLFYAIEQKKTAGVILFSLLILSVKEDAAAYVAIIGLYILLDALLHKGKENRWNLFAGIGLFLCSLLWFICVTGFLSSHGDGIMTYRYQNFMYDGSSSLHTVVKAVILCPMKALFECVDSEKISFIALTFLPLLAVPLFTRRYERLILLIPYLLINLMSDYQYQHSIFFQYTFGSVAFLFYLYVINIADFKSDWGRIPVLIISVLLSFVFFTNNVLPKASFYYTNYQNNKTHYTQVRDALRTVPDDATVSASTFYTTFLSQRPVLYDVKYASWEHILSTEYIILDPTNDTSYKPYAVDGENGYENFTAYLEENGYTAINQRVDCVTIYKKDA